MITLQISEFGYRRYSLEISQDYVEFVLQPRSNKMATSCQRFVLLVGFWNDGGAAATALLRVDTRPRVEVVETSKSSMFVERWRSGLS
ncbi:hypothetical protein NPIL_5891 [Nephila pilipes]|uniref:Uncharacterized protein n=1 Tax=Nephila pilipes TaxID=299642 RepID=A0A8X6QYG7_NEPPI|nr:hypothetical protein NPIL_5891 [Nephila pilipes]